MSDDDYSTSLSSSELDSSTDADPERELEPSAKRKYMGTLHNGMTRQKARYYRRKSNTVIQSSYARHCSIEQRATGSQANSDDDASGYTSSASLSNTSLSETEVESLTSSDDSLGYTSDTESESDSDLNDSNSNSDNIEHDTPLYDGCRYTKYSLYSIIMLFVIKHSLSRDAFSDMLGIISTVLPKSCSFTTSVYKLKETLKTCLQLRSPKIHFFCENCQKSLPDNAQPCQNLACRRSNSKMLDFYDLHMIEQIKMLFQEEWFFNMIRMQMGKPQSDAMRDITDGLVYKNIKEDEQQAVINLTFTMNTDGVALFSSSKKGNLWPVYIAVNELPAKIRYLRKCLIPCFLYCHPEKPNMLTYLTPMMDILKKFHNSGIEMMTPIGKVLVKAKLLAVSLDLPARALVSNMKQFNGKFPCTLCLDEGASMPEMPMHRFFPYNFNMQLRTHQSVLDDVQAANRFGEASRGVKGASPLIVLKYIDFPKTFVLDWMHCVHLGVTKALMSFWFDSKHKNKDYFIGNKMDLLNQRLLGIKTPDFISRRPRSLEDYKHWKVTAMSLLSKDGVLGTDIDYAEGLLEDFCIVFPDIYGPTSQTMNVHLLRHAAAFTRLFGPLYGYSCYGFESMNAHLKNMVHGTRYVNNQVSLAVGFTKSLPGIVRNLTENSFDMSVKTLALHLGSKFIQDEKTETDGLTITKGKKKKILSSYKHYQTIPPGLRNTLLNSFCRIMKCGMIYHSKQYSLAKTRNNFTISFIQNGEIKFGDIVSFVQSENNLYAIIEEFSTKLFSLGNNFEQLVSIRKLKKYCKSTLCPHIKEITSCLKKVLFIPVESIKKKCLFIDICELTKYISIPPNFIEHA